MRIALCVLLLALTVCPPAVRADDSGPRRDLSAIRHDLPILLQWSSAIQIDHIEVNNGSATVKWHDASNDDYVSALKKRYDRWWLLTDTDPCASTGTAETLFQANFPLRLTGDGYRVAIRFATNDATDNAGIESFTSRAPTETESWVNYPSGNSYFFFSGTVQSTLPVHVQAGTTIDVWFPFVLDPSLRYSLTIAAPNVMSIGPVDGTLADNTLHFVLPAFTAVPGADLMGEIESD